MRLSSTRAVEQGRVLVQLALSQALADGDPAAALREITEVAARTLAVERVGVWLFDEARESLRCIELFELSAQRHGQGTQLAAAFYPAYFAALEDTRALAIRDAEGDPQTRELAETYLRPLGITSMLDVPIRTGGRLTGVVCHEHVGQLRRWSLAEQQFASSIGDLAALALETAERRTAVDILRRSEAKFRSLIESTSDLVIVTDRDGSVRYASPSHERLLGMKADGLIGTRAIDRCHPEDRSRFAATARRAWERPGEPVHCELRLQTVDGHWRVFDIVTRNLIDDPVVAGFVVNGHDITDRKREQEEKDALLEISRDIAGTLDLQQLLDRVLAKTVAVLGCDVAVMFRRDADEPLGRPIAQHGFSSEVVNNVNPDFRFQEPTGETAAWEPVLLINNVGETPLAIADACALVGIHSIMIARTRARDRLIGSLVVGHRVAGRNFEPRQMPLLEGIARQLSVAMEAAELYQAQADTAAVAAALARVGQVMISSLDTPVLLEGLCHVTTEVLDCDFSHTLLLEPATDALSLVSSYGDSPEQSAAKDQIHFGNASASTAIAELRTVDVVHRSLSALRRGPIVDLGTRLGVTDVLCIGLRRGPDLVGMQTAGYRGRDQTFTERQKQIARGIAQLASLGLENARLVEELALADRRKSEFVATVSHELRTPLNVIVGYSDMLLDGGNGMPASQQADVLQRIRQNALGLYELITSTLDFSRVESGLPEIEVCETEIDNLLGEVVRDTQRTHGKPDVTIRCGDFGKLPPLHTDRAKLKVILANLASNALKFTEHGSVTLSAAAIASGIEIAVADTGRGIPAGALQTIFEPFHQVSESNGHQRGGFGLGLHIVRRLLAQIKGEIEVQSTLGRGSVFRVRVPQLRELTTHG